MRTRIVILMISAGAFCLASTQDAWAWRGGGFGGFHGGGFGGFHGGGFGGSSSFHAGGFGGGFGSVHYAGASHYGPATGFTHVGGATYAGAGGVAHYGGTTHVGGGGAEHYGSWGGYHEGDAWGGFHGASTYHSVNYGSISHYGAAAYHGPYSSGAVVKGPAGYGAAVYHGPAGGTAAAYRGHYSAGAVAHLPSGYTATAWHGTTYYHSGYSFYHPVWYAGTVSYVPILPPVGFFFAALPAGATQTVINNNTYYVSDGAYYQPSTQNGQQGYAVVEAPAQSGGSQGSPTAGGAAPDPFQVLKKMSDYLGREKHIIMKVSETFDEVAFGGQKIELSSEREIWLERPDKLEVKVSGAGTQRRIVCDGTTFTIIDEMKNVYASVPMQGPLDAVLDKVAQQYGMAAPGSDLLYSDVYAHLSSKIQAGQYLDEEYVQGHKCSHLAFTQANLAWQIWIGEGDKPVPWKVVITYASAPGRPQYQLLVTRWETPVIMRGADFEARIPAGAMSASMTTLTGQ